MSRDSADIDQVQKAISSIIKKRKNYLNVIEQSLTNDDALFVKCFRLSDSLESTLKCSDLNSPIRKRNWFLLGTFLSNTIYMDNSQQKLTLLLNICEAYEQFEIMSTNPDTSIVYNAKYSISQLPRIALNPIRTDIYSPLPVHADSSDLQRDFAKMARTMTIPEEMSFDIVLETLCHVLSLTYNMFADSAYESSKEALELILKIDGIVYARLLSPIISLYFQSTESLLDDEFTKVKEILFDEDKHLDYTSLDSLIKEA